MMENYITQMYIDNSGFLEQVNKQLEIKAISPSEAKQLEIDNNTIKHNQNIKFIVDGLNFHLINGQRKFVCYKVQDQATFGMDDLEAVSKAISLFKEKWSNVTYREIPKENNHYGGYEWEFEE